MNKDILARNIENVITQPSYTMYHLKTMPNGVSEDGKYIMVQVTPDDSSWKCDLVDKDDNAIDFVGNILDMLPEKYREHLVTLEHDGWLSYSYRPVFDTDTQKMWDDSTSSYIKLKQEWCEKYGCD